MAYRYILL